MGMRRIAAMAGALAMLATVLAVTAPVSAQATPTCNGRAATIVGTEGNDRIEGTEGNDVIVGLGGFDVIFGRGGNDTICGGRGTDVIKGGRGNDYIEGNESNDRLIGGSGRDTMNGGPGRDRVFGGNGPDDLAGGNRRDLVNGQNGNDTCDLDSLDRFALCELGDVRGVSGFGEATTNVDVPSDFITYRSGTGPALQGFSLYVYGWNVLRSGSGLTTVIISDAQGNELDRVSSLNQHFFGQSILFTTGPAPAQVTISTGGASVSFDVAFVLLENLTRLPEHSSGIAPAVFVLDPTALTGRMLQLMVGAEASGNAIVFTFDNAGRLELPINQIVTEGEAPTYVAQTANGIYMVQVFVGGSWQLWITPLGP